jgi:hypothetical protein
MSGSLKIEQCDCEEIRECGPFANWNDYNRFFAFLNASDSFLSVPVVTPYPCFGLVVPDPYLGVPEYWFQCKKCEKIWRLLRPDPPFAGIWEPVDSTQGVSA